MEQQREEERVDQGERRSKVPEREQVRATEAQERQQMFLAMIAASMNNKNSNN